jgi:hypothetical protein
MKLVTASMLLAAATLPVAADFDLTGSLGAESRLFLEDGSLPGQLNTFQGSLELELDARWSLGQGRWDVVVVPYARLDEKDSKRTHFDLREAYVRYNGDVVSVRAGLAKVYWGVAESVHLVDIINQSDSIEDLDNEDKLGQPMLEISMQQDWGLLTGYLMPAFRKRTFPGVNGRLRLPLPVDNDLALFDQGADDDADVDFALRYSHYFGDWDVGLSFFHGANREARFVVDQNANAFATYYDNITQVGLDLQYTKEAWLWKFEGIVRDTPFETFTAAVGGVEYSFYGITESGADLGVLVEFQYDGRSEDPLISPASVADQDVMLGARYTMNDADDTSVLAGVVTDLGDGSMSGILEATKRFGDVWVGEIEGRFFMNVDPNNTLAGFKEDSHLMLRLSRYF